MKFKSQLQALVFIIIFSGCYSSPGLWRSDSPNQIHLLKPSFMSQIAVQESVFANSRIRTGLLDSIANNIQPKSMILFNALDSHLIDSGFSDSILEYSRQYIDGCSDSRSEYTHKLLITKVGNIIVPEKSFYLHYGCEHGVELMKFDRLVSTDSSILMYGKFHNESNLYIRWIELVYGNYSPKAKNIIR